MKHIKMKKLKIKNEIALYEHSQITKTKNSIIKHFHYLAHKSTLLFESSPNIGGICRVSQHFMIIFLHSSKKTKFII